MDGEEGLVGGDVGGDVGDVGNDVGGVCLFLSQAL